MDHIAGHALWANQFSRQIHYNYVNHPFAGHFLAVYVDSIVLYSKTKGPIFLFVGFLRFFAK